MSRQVFFSFHFKRDAWRVSQIRNAWVVEGTANKILDWADWEQIERKGNAAVQNWIDTQMKGASVTVVLIGDQTYARPWVKYEIKRSAEEGKGLLGVYLNGMKDSNQNVSGWGPNPFDYASLPRGTTYQTYSWIDDNGRANLHRWVEAAARSVGR